MTIHATVPGDSITAFAVGLLMKRDVTVTLDGEDLHLTFPEGSELVTSHPNFDKVIVPFFNKAESRDFFTFDKGMVENREESVMSDRETVQIVWTRDPADPEKVPFVYAARDVPSIENDPEDWEGEISEAVAVRGHQHVVVTEVSVDFKSVLRAFEPTDISLGKIASSLASSGVAVMRNAEGFVAPIQ